MNIHVMVISLLLVVQITTQMQKKILHKCSICVVNFVAHRALTQYSHGDEGIHAIPEKPFCRACFPLQSSLQSFNCLFGKEIYFTNGHTSHSNTTMTGNTTITSSTNYYTNAIKLLHKCSICVVSFAAKNPINHYTYGDEGIQAIPEKPFYRACPLEVWKTGILKTRSFI